MPIQASVGKHSQGVKQCYNLPADQLRVANLLDLIGVDKGGTDGALLLTLQQIRYGAASEKLYKAIQTFQNKQFRVSDGHVDPGEKTIARLEELAFKESPKEFKDLKDAPNVPNAPFLPPPNIQSPGLSAGDKLGRVLDIASFAGSGAEIVLEAVGAIAFAAVAEVFGAITAIISTILSLPMAWRNADKNAHFNGFCHGYWMAMQDMANAFKDNSLDYLIQMTVVPYQSVPVAPAPWPMPTWPAIPVPAPHMSALNESQIGESERQNRIGEREGCQKAIDYIKGLEQSPQTITANAAGRQYKVVATGKVMLRLVYKGSKGDVSGMIQAQVNKELAAKGQGPWPLYK